MLTKTAEQGILQKPMCVTKIRLNKRIMRVKNKCSEPFQIRIGVIIIILINNII